MSSKITLNTPAKSPSSDGVYYFSHIPKTAGTSMTVILDRFFSVNDIFVPQLWHEVGSVGEVREKNYKLFRGHFGAAGHVLSHEKLKVLTILRHPIDLAYSTYLHIKRDVNTRVHNYVNENDLSFDEFITDERTQNLVKNRLIKSLSFGLGLEQGSTDLFVDEDTYKSNRKAWNKYRKTLSQAQLLKAMKHYLDDCFWFGFQEEFNLSLSMLCHKMSWPSIGETSKLNTNNKKINISDKALRALKELNQMDFEFYEYAKIKFNQLAIKFYQQLSVDKNTTESVDTKVDHQYQKNHIKMYSNGLKEFVCFDFSQVLLGKNWHRREWSDDDQKYFRWTGPSKTTSIDFWLKSNDYQVCIAFVNKVDDKLFEHLMIEVNGEPVKWSIDHDENKGQIKFGCDHRLIQENGLLRISMKSDDLSKFDTLLNSQDKRLVGMAINQIDIKRSGV